MDDIVQGSYEIARGQVRMAAAEYDIIKNLYSFSVLQDARAENASTSKVAAHFPMTRTLKVIQVAFQAAQHTVLQFGRPLKQSHLVLA